MSDDIKLPELGQTYNLIATYSVRHDHLSDIDRLSKWQELINSIKDYARAAVELNRSDTVRLDWIADGGRVAFDRDIFMWVAAENDGTPYWGDTMRKAIDNAISRYKSTTAPEHGEG